jgi:hypothetical protein
MKVEIKSLLARGILGGIWGLTAVISAYTFEGWLPMSSLLFYPLIFAGAVPLAVLFTGKGVPLLRAVSVGVISGLIYQLLSPVFPLFASVLAGASLGGGLSHNAGKPGGLLEVILTTLKGSVMVPMIILTGSFLGESLYKLTESPMAYWYFWGFWAALGISLIPRARSKKSGPEHAPRNRSVLDDFKEDARDIKRDLSELNCSIK